MEPADPVFEHVHTPSRKTPEQAPEHQHDSGPQLASTLGNANVGRILNSGVQRAGATTAQALDEQVARTISERAGKGSPLPDTTRTDMETNLGQDFSNVRVHTDAESASLNEQVSARAFTSGSDIFLKSSSQLSDRSLLGHELTHVVQQRTGASGLDGGQMSSPSDASEQHAEAVGQQVASQPAVTTPVARDADEHAGHDHGPVQRTGAAPEEELEGQGSYVQRANAPEEELEGQGSYVQRANAPEEELEGQGSYVQRANAPEEELEGQGSYEVQRQAAAPEDELEEKPPGQGAYEVQRVEEKPEEELA